MFNEIRGLLIFSEGRIFNGEFRIYIIGAPRTIAKFSKNPYAPARVRKVPKDPKIFLIACRIFWICGVVANVTDI